MYSRLRDTVVSAATMAIALLLVSAVIYAEGTSEQEEVDYMTFEGSHSPNWELEASNGLLIGGYGDNFDYDGSDVTPVGGSATVDVNAEDNTGSMEVVFNGTIHPEKDQTYSGEIRIVYDQFSEGSDFWEGGIADYVYLHGDTGQEAPVMPKVRSFLASWGPADVYVDGEMIYEDLAGHMMLTERSRDPETYEIFASDGESYYSPKNPGDSSIVAPDERELHFVAHTTEQDTGNFPPHTVWIHLNFMEVEEL